MKTATLSKSQLRQLKIPRQGGNTHAYKAGKKPVEMKPLHTLMQGISAELNASQRARHMGKMIKKHQDSPNIVAWLNGNFTTT